MKSLREKTFFLSLFFLLTISSSSLAASPPEQPSSGPGGADYSHGAVISNTYFSNDIPSYCLFEPDSPKPSTAPLILFFPGIIQVQGNPNYYGNWVDHIVKKGNIIIFPLYDSSIFLISPECIPNIIITVQAAIKELQAGNHVRPDLDKFAILGHSSGGIFVANISAVAKGSNLPSPRAIMMIAPSSSPFPSLTDQLEDILEDLSQIPEDALFLAVAGDVDYISTETINKTIFYSIPQIPLENKDFITLVSDSHGSPALIADHFAPCCMPYNEDHSPFATNTLDYYGYFKLFDSLTDAAFFGKNKNYALGNTPEQRYMGKWSDGTPVKELVVTDNP